MEEEVGTAGGCWPSLWGEVMGINRRGGWIEGWTCAGCKEFGLIR